MIHEKFQNNIEYKLHLFEEVSDYSNNYLLNKNIIVQLYQLGIQLITEKKEEDYNKLKELYFINIKKITNEIASDISVSLINHIA